MPGNEAQPRVGSQSATSWWRRWRRHYWASLAGDVALLLGVMWAIHAWQTRDLPADLPAASFAAETELPALGGNRRLSVIGAEGRGVVYFFAPWCGWCRSSIGNVDGLLADGSIDWARAVALSYSSETEVAEFAARTGIGLPVLLGTDRTARDWSIKAFPTYFVIDADGTVLSRSVGYSTWLGLKLRTLAW
jgi:thiol-disulfide isomerase/thioredoxin